MWPTYANQVYPSPPVTTVNMADLVNRQVANLHSFFPGGQICTVKPERFELQLVVGPTRTTVKLIIELPPSFPDVPPNVRIHPMVAHRWVDASTMQVVGHEALRTWNRNMSLGKVIKDIEIEFNLRPPTILAIPSTAKSPSTLPVKGATNTESFPEIDGLSAKDIRKLLEGPEDELEKWFGNLGAVLSARAVQEELYEANLLLARDNLIEAESLDRQRERIEELKTILELEEAELGQLVERHRSVLSKFTIENIKDDFTKEISEAEEAASQIASKFTNNELTIGEFISAYMTAQTAFHRRSMSFEKLKQNLKADGTRS